MAFVFRPGVYLCCLLLISSVVSSGCQEDRSAIVKQKVQERVAEFREKQRVICRMALYEKAGRMADSILIAEAKQEVQDSLGRLRPFRPSQPPDVLPIDSARVAPLFMRNATGN
ncbi:MAG: hypothetical protein RJA20_1302 [Bacteroidota bacterium]|jgi:hypothetical protein